MEDGGHFVSASMRYVDTRHSLIKAGNVKCHVYTNCAKWLTFRRQHFQAHFLERKLLCIVSKFTEISSQLYRKQLSIINCGNDWMINRRQDIIYVMMVYCIYIYTKMCICMCMCIYMYMYMYIYTYTYTGHSASVCKQCCWQEDHNGIDNCALICTAVNQNK